MKESDGSWRTWRAWRAYKTGLSGWEWSQKAEIGKEGVNERLCLWAVGWDNRWFREAAYVCQWMGVNSVSLACRIHMGWRDGESRYRGHPGCRWTWTPNKIQGTQRMMEYPCHVCIEEWLTWYKNTVYSSVWVKMHTNNSGVFLDSGHSRTLYQMIHSDI